MIIHGGELLHCSDLIWSYGPSSSKDFDIKDVVFGVCYGGRGECGCVRGGCQERKEEVGELHGGFVA
jgi:hypothetical protein